MEKKKDIVIRSNNFHCNYSTFNICSVAELSIKPLHFRFHCSLFPYMHISATKSINTYVVIYPPGGYRLLLSCVTMF